jgi:hypothetical protein
MNSSWTIYYDELISGDLVVHEIPYESDTTFIARFCIGRMPAPHCGTCLLLLSIDGQGDVILWRCDLRSKFNRSFLIRTKHHG